MDYKELVFYQKSCEVVKRINSEIKVWPRNMQSQEIARQIFRAATSIGANIAEGHGRHSGREYIHFLRIAQGSANEVDHWLHTAIYLTIGSSENLNFLIELNNETRKMLTATIKTLWKKQDK